MIKSVFSQIWKDSVWSKIIAAGILTLISIIYTLVSSSYQEITFIYTFNNFWNFKIPF